MNNFSKLIYKLRKEKGWTQAELGEKLNLTDKAISRWETSESLPETQQLVPLSILFNITIDELLKGERKTKNDNIKEELGEKREIKENQNFSQKINKVKKLLFNKKFMLITVPILVIIITLSSFIAVFKNNYNAVLEQKSEVYPNDTFEEIEGEYEIETYDTYKEFKSSELADKVIYNKPLKQERYNRFYFMTFVLLVVKFTDLKGYNYYISNMGFNSTNITVELVASRCAEYYNENPSAEQTYYCYVNLPKKSIFVEEYNLKLSEMNVNFNIEERFEAAKTMPYFYISPDQSDPFNVYYSERKDFEFYRATSKEGMDEYRILDEGMNFSTVIGNMIYSAYYNDEFFEDKDLYFVQSNSDSHMSISMNIVNNEVKIRGYIQQITLHFAMIWAPHYHYLKYLKALQLTIWK